ncbi:winged helix-turn-helix transcriptional regulator [Williamsia phyllosphaerae]|uniref:Transcriptional regulator n=1 Tax=Williamsia phyllosphaerae TaxID=885042 RepID=A0ABQ1UA69_9NOCA|nr:helix-turn-helix domain-containing protein [Williamsia phyllosphaerae]GGF12451.1 transcriptional regulator [Williamsia phyllosphaerae]
MEEFDRSRWSAENCSVKAALGIVGDRWTMQVLREAYYGARRFEQFHAGVGCARTVLTDRLNTLVDHDLMYREPYREPHARQRHEYRLTRAGMELFPAMIALMQWGDRWLAGADGPPVEVIHQGCGAGVRAELVCSDGHRELTPQRVGPRLGPGARPGR